MTTFPKSLRKRFVNVSHIIDEISGERFHYEFCMLLFEVFSVYYIDKPIIICKRVIRFFRSLKYLGVK
jgi:hypothetical protein